MTRPFVRVAVLLTVLGGCGDDAARDGRPAATTRPARAAPPAISELDGGSSFTLGPGSETHLRLSGAYTWSEPTVRGPAVELTRVDYVRDPGFSEWTVLAVRPGRATISARGTPACDSRPRCPDEPLRFRVELTVPP